MVEREDDYSGLLPVRCEQTKRKVVPNSEKLSPTPPFVFTTLPGLVEYPADCTSGHKDKNDSAVFDFHFSYVCGLYSICQ